MRGAGGTKSSTDRLEEIPIRKPLHYVTSVSEFIVRGEAFGYFEDQRLQFATATCVRANY